MKQRIALLIVRLTVIGGYLWLQCHPQGEAA